MGTLLGVGGEASGGHPQPYGDAREGATGAGRVVLIYISRDTPENQALSSMPVLDLRQCVVVSPVTASSTSSMGSGSVCSSTLRAGQSSPAAESLFSEAKSETTRKMIVPHSTDY